MRTAIAFASLLLAITAHAAEPSAARQEGAQKPAQSNPVQSNPAPSKANSESPTASDQKDAKDNKSAPTPASGTQPSSRQPATPARRATDRLELDTSVVTGNRELPKVLYIVPWKKADIGDLPQQPFNTLLDEALTPIDRDVFRREVTYYGAVSAGANAPDAPPVSPAAGPEK